MAPKKDNYSYRVDSTGKTGSCIVTNSLYRLSAHIADAVKRTSPVEIQSIRSKFNQFELVDYDLMKSKNALAVLNGKTEFTEVEKDELYQLNKRLATLTDSVNKGRQAEADYKAEGKSKKIAGLEDEIAELGEVESKINTLKSGKVLSATDIVMVESLKKDIADLEVRKGNAMSAMCRDSHKDATWGSIKNDRLLIGIYAVISAIADISPEILPIDPGSDNSDRDSADDFNF